MLRVPFYSSEDIKDAIRGSTQAFEAGMPDVQTTQQEEARDIWYAAMDAVALSLGVEWREKDVSQAD